MVIAIAFDCNSPRQVGWSAPFRARLAHSPCPKAEQLEGLGGGKKSVLTIESRNKTAKLTQFNFHRAGAAVSWINMRILEPKQFQFTTLNTNYRFSEQDHLKMSCKMAKVFH